MNVQSSSLKFSPNTLTDSLIKNSFISHFIECIKAVFVVIGDAFKSLLAWNKNLKPSVISAPEIQVSPQKATESAVKQSTQESIFFIQHNTPLLLSVVGLLGSLFYRAVGVDSSQHPPMKALKIPLLYHLDKIENISKAKMFMEACPSVDVVPIASILYLRQIANSVSKFVADNSSALVPYFPPMLRIPSKEIMPEFAASTLPPLPQVCQATFSPATHLLRVAIECIDSHASVLKYGFLITAFVSMLYCKRHHIWELKNATFTPHFALPTVDLSEETILLVTELESQVSESLSSKKMIPLPVPAEISSSKKLSEFFNSIKLQERTQNETLFWKKVLTTLFSSLTAPQIDILSEDRKFWTVIFDRDFVKVAANHFSADCLWVLAEKAFSQRKYEPNICKLLLNLEPIDLQVKSNYFSFAAKLKVFESYWCPMFDAMHFNYLSSLLKTNKAPSITASTKATTLLLPPPQTIIQNFTLTSVSDDQLEKFVETNFLNVFDPLKVNAFFSDLKILNDESIAKLVLKLGDNCKNIGLLWKYFKHDMQESDYPTRARLLKVILASITCSQIIVSVNAETILDIISDEKRGYAAVASKALSPKQLDTLVLSIPLQKVNKLMPLIENLSQPSTELEKTLIGEKLHAIESMYFENAELTALIEQKKIDLETFNF